MQDCVLPGLILFQRFITSLFLLAKVLDEARKLEKDGNIVTRFSVTGYSLGGLVARYLVG